MDVAMSVLAGLRHVLNCEQRILRSLDGQAATLSKPLILSSSTRLAKLEQSESTPCLETKFIWRGTYAFIVGMQ